MIKFITTYLKEKADARAIEAAKAKKEAQARTARKRNALIKEIKELRLITINNARYIRSSINTIGGLVNHAKGSNAAETKRKREFLRKRLDWLKRKQGEEEGMILYYDSLLKKI